MNPLVSVIIPTKNSARTLEECLQSVKNQSYENIELIVVDNNSTDETKQIAKKYTDLVFNFGPERSAQRNFGAKKAKGKYLLIHDSDIYFHKNSVKECLEIAQKENCQAIILPEKSIGVGFWTKVKAFERSFYVGNDYIEAVRFFDREAFVALGGYDEMMYAGEDWDITIRFRKNGSKILRAENLISHDEGKLNLFGSSKKKQYYAKNLFAVYAQKNPEYFKQQMKFLVRFPLDRIFKNILIHPILFSTMIVMKTVELFNSKKVKINL